MKKFSLLILAAVLIGTSCKPGKDHESNEGHTGDCCKKTDSTEAAGFDPDVSLFDLTSTWYDQDSQQMQFDDLDAKVFVTAMIFTQCQSACPRIASDLQRIEQSIPPEKIGSVRFLLISMDPWRDSPSRLREFAREHQLTPGRWTLLTATESDVLEVSSVLNVRVKRMSDGNFDHSNIIHILDGQGHIVHQQVGLAISPEASVASIMHLLE